MQAAGEALTSEHETETTEIPEDELEAEEAEELPARETMMILDPGPDVGIGPGPYPWPESEAPDDRYEQ
jgi:hypothetical protein